MSKSSFFGMDNPINRFFSVIFDLLIIGLLTAICSLPIVTMGAAITANYDVMIRIALKKEHNIFKQYFKAFGKNFLKSTAMWMVSLVLVAVMVAAWYMVFGGVLNVAKAVSTVILVITIIISLLLSFVITYIFPLQARFENKITQTFKNAFFISLAQLPRSLFMVAITVGVGVACFFWTGLAPIFLLALFSVGFYLFSCMFVKIFAAYGDREAAGEYVPEEEWEEAEEAAETEAENAVDSVEESAEETKDAEEDNQ